MEVGHGRHLQEKRIKGMIELGVGQGGKEEEGKEQRLSEEQEGGRSRKEEGAGKREEQEGGRSRRR